jgi:hypothetical protein
MNIGNLARRVDAIEGAVKRIAPRPQPEIPDWLAWLGCDELGEAEKLCALCPPSGQLPAAAEARLLEIEATARRRQAEGLPCWDAITARDGPWHAVYWASWFKGGYLDCGVAQTEWVYARVRKLMLETRVA